jgi:membrane dipeptidase
MRIFDLHCDTLFKFYENGRYSLSQNDGHIADQGLLNGGYIAQCFAVYQPTDITGDSGFEFFKNQCEAFKNIVKGSSVLEFATCKKDIERNRQNGKVSAVLTVENADFLQGDISKIEAARENGVKTLGLVHNGENCLGFPHSIDRKLNAMPLKGFGCEVVDALNSTDITVDVSHLNFGGFNNVKVLSKKPFIATHSACRELCEHTRNLYDSQINDIANSGGIIGVPFYSLFLNGTNSTAILDIVTHLEHLIKIGGEDVAAIGTDFDGMNCNLFLKNCSGMHILADALIKKFGINLTEKICYKNALRVLG